MQLVHIDSLPIENRKSTGREGSYQRRVVMRGDPDSPGNFSLIIYYHDGSFRSPRHHHNFDQFRFQIDGTNDFGRNGKMTPGVLGYFPEGAYYGPQVGPPHVVAVLQFGGPSGAGYIGMQEHADAAAELRQVGTFEKGLFRRNPGTPGKPQQDAYEAIWEHIRRRRLVYPKPQYVGPIMMDSNSCPAMPIEAMPGVRERPLGTFTHCQMRSARYELEPDSSLRAAGRGIFLVLSGRGTVGDESYREQTTVYLGDGEEVIFRAETPTDILLMGMPGERLLADQRSSTLLEAAE